MKLSRYVNTAIENLDGDFNAVSNIYLIYIYIIFINLIYMTSIDFADHWTFKHNRINIVDFESKQEFNVY
jgi:hypothetical protein